MTNTTRPDGAVQVPLHELLRSVPQDARLVIDEGSFGTRYIPVGRYCHEAAAALTSPASKPADDEQQELARMKEVLRTTPGINGTFDGVGKPAEGGVVEMRDTLGFALENLLEDTQHKEHIDCEEGACPVRDARRVIAEWRAALAREGGERG